MSLAVYLALTLVALVATLLLPYETKGRPMQVSTHLHGEEFIIVRTLYWLFLDILEVLKRAVVVD